MRKKLTERQRTIYEFIVDTIRTKGYPPTIREMMEEFHIASTNGVRTTLSALAKKGYIRRRPMLSRGIELTDFVERQLPHTVEVSEVPVVGRVAAGEPVLAVENLTIVTNAGFNADGRGFLTGGPGHTFGWGPGGGQNDAGGGYGGKGGDALPYGVGGAIYGSSNAPVDPGSGGGGEAGVFLGSGGGLIRIEASGAVSLRGQLTANGAYAGGWGSGAGGGIHIRCRKFAGDSNGVIRADGASGGTSRIGGGGGRVAIWRSKDISGGTVRASADGGYGTWSATSTGGPGTVVWGMLAEEGTLLLLW